MYYPTPTITDAITSFSQAAAFIPIAVMADTDINSLYLLKDGKSELQRWSSLIGIITAITGNILISFALNIQRYAHIRLHQEALHRKERLKKIGKSSQNGYGTNGSNGANGHVAEHAVQDADGEDNPLQSSFHSEDSRSSGYSHEDDNQDSSYLRSPYWWGGIVLMTVGEAGNFLAYGFAPASIVSPLGVVALISNCIIAPCMLKERFRPRDFWGVVIAVAGAVVVVLSAKQEEKKLGPHEIWGAITTTEFEIYMGVTVFLIGVLSWASPRYGNKTILVDLGLVGLFGGYTALSTKGIASMLSSTLWRALTTPVTYALFAVLIGTAIMQVKYVNKALQRFDSTQVIPIQFVMFTLSVIIGSAILYRDFEKATADSVGKFVGGCLLTFFGVWLITSGRKPRDEDSDDESDVEGEGQERINLAQQDPDSHQKHHEYSSVRRRPIIHDGDATNDDFNSRRSSHVSFAEPSSLPRVSQMFSNSSYQPSGRLVPSILPPDVDIDEDTPLLSGALSNSNEDLIRGNRHPGLPNAISTPQPPTEAQMAAESSLKPPPVARTSSQGNVHTHPNHHTTPNPPQADRPMTPARHSISRMMPGPFLSPLSGGLSAVVADSLMRGVDMPARSKSYRRPRPGTRRSNSGSQRLSRLDLEGEDEELGSSPPKNGSSGAGQDMSKSLDSSQGQNDWARITRARSLSTTLGDLFRGKKHTGDRPGTPGDEESSPSGS